jgi:hypothetical protein
MLKIASGLGAKSVVRIEISDGSPTIGSTADSCTEPANITTHKKPNKEALKHATSWPSLCNIICIKKVDKRDGLWPRVILLNYIFW